MREGFWWGLGEGDRRRRKGGVKGLEEEGAGGPLSRDAAPTECRRVCVVYIIYIRVAGRVKVTEELNPGDPRNLEFFLFLVICTTKEKRIVKNANCLRGESPSSDIKIREHTRECCPRE